MGNVIGIQRRRYGAPVPIARARARPRSASVREVHRRDAIGGRCFAGQSKWPAKGDGRWQLARRLEAIVVMPKISTARFQVRAVLLGRWLGRLAFVRQ